MNIDLAVLPDDVDTLHRMIGDLAAALDTERVEAQAEIDRLRQIVKMLQRSRFGRRSERLDDDQLQLGLEDLDADIARAESDLLPLAPGKEQKPRRASDDRPSLPDHLPREDVTLDIGAGACPCCGGAVHKIGETVSEMLDYVPARLRVLRIRRPKYGCRAFGTIHQAPAPERPIAKGFASPGLLAHVLVSKYCDHLPLYRQSQIFALQGVDLNRSTLANWVGGATWWLEALRARLADHVFASDKLFADDTPIPVLDPGRGRTRLVLGPASGRTRGTGRLWVYARDDRPWGGPDPPAAVYFYNPDRKAERPAAHLDRFRGVLQVDGGACPRAIQGRTRGPGSRSSPRVETSSSPHAGPTPDASSTSSIKRPVRRSPPRRCIVSPRSMRSKGRSAAAARPNAKARAAAGRGLWSTR